MARKKIVEKTLENNETVYITNPFYGSKHKQTNITPKKKKRK